MPDEDLQPLITALTEATCSKCKGTSYAAADEHGIITDWTPCSDCNGTGRSPLTELLRVKCDCKDLGVKDCCDGWLSATPDEAEAVGLKLLAALDLGVWREDNVWISCPNELRERADGQDATPLEAVLNAMAQAVGVEVPA